MCCSLLLMEFFRILMPFFEKLVLSKCWWHFQVKQHLDYLPTLVGNTHKRDLHVSVSACILLCSKTFSGAQAVECWTQLFLWESQPLMKFTKDSVSRIHSGQTLRQRRNFSGAIFRHW